jgi:hypothetical protein
MLRRIWLWLRRWFSPAGRVTMLPEGTCDHSLDPQETIRRLREAAAHPTKVVEEFAHFVNCPGCHMAVTWQLLYELEGQLLVDQGDDEQVSESELCGHKFSPVIGAMRLELYIKDGDDLGVAKTFDDAHHCPACLEAMCLCVANSSVATKDAVGVDWQAMYLKRMAELLPPDKKK